MKSSKKSQYLNDFKMNDDGKYEYQGKYYVFAGSNEERRKTYSLLWLMYVVCTVLTIASGFIDGAGLLNTFYVIIPYIGEIACLFALSWNHLKLLTKKDQIKEYIYQTAHAKIAPSAMMLAFFAIVGILSSVVYSVLNGFDGWKTMIYLVLKILTAVSALLYRNYFSQSEWIML